MATGDYSIRTMTRGEIDLAVDWAGAEGWNPGLQDAVAFHAADPDGFYVGLLDGDPIATISAVRYGKSFGFVGFYIVKREQRGKGYGLRLWDAALATLRGRNVGLDGVVDQQANYRKSGFALAYRNIRYQGTAGGEAHRDDGIVPLSTIAFADVVGYDRPFFPEDRGDFLRHWIALRGSTAIGIRAADGRLVGYAVMRPCRNGFKVGPLFADAPNLAERLFAHLASRAPAGAPVFLDIPEVNAAARDLVQRHGMTAAFETARMYTGRFPDLPIERLYGVTTFELG